MTRRPSPSCASRPRHRRWSLGALLAAAALLAANASAAPTTADGAPSEAEAPSEEPDLDNDPILQAEAPVPPAAPRPAASTAATASASVASAPATEGEPALVLPAAITGGLGVLGMVMFAGFGGASQSTYSQLEDECRDGHCPPELADEAAAARAQQAIANTAVVCGATLLVAGGVLFAFSQWDVAAWFGDAEDDATPSAALSVGPGSLAVRGRF